MTQYIVLRLHPDQPVNGSVFTTYLSGLSLSVVARTYDHPNGVVIGTATAAGIHQHSWQTTPNPPHLLSVATAVIEVPAAPEFLALDVKIVLYRGSQQVWAYDWNHNPATLAATSAPTVASYAALTTVSAYLAIPTPSQALEPPGAHIELANDGTPPSFGALAQAIAYAAPKVPVATANLATLSQAQALALASFITWDYALYAMPVTTYVPAVNLEAMYTLNYVYPPGPNSGALRNVADANGAIALFTADLTTQQINAANRMAQYVYAYSAALAGEGTSKTATSALLTVPAHTTSNPQPGKLDYADINLQFTPSPTLSFGVPAAYFYALTLSLPASITPAARYQQVLSGEPGVNLDAINNALLAGTINAADDSLVPPVAPAQAVRRLQALAGENGAPVALVNTPATIALVSAWLAFNATDDIADFWSAAVATPIVGQSSSGGPLLSGQLEFMLDVVTDDQPPLANVIRGIPISNVDQLAALTENDWTAFFLATSPASSAGMLAFLAAPGGTVDRMALLSANLLPGADAGERVMAFIGGLRKFYTVERVPAPTPSPSAVPPPQLAAPQTDLFQQFTAAYKDATQTEFMLSTGVDGAVESAIEQTADGDDCVREWLTNAIRTLSDLQSVAGAAPDELRFSVMEALYARGFTGQAAIQKLSLEDFTAALTGSVAFDYAGAIYEAAGGGLQEQSPIQEAFQPINPDGLLTNCIPPAYLSPLGPVAYLNEMLRVCEASTCANPTPAAAGGTLADLLASRRGPLGNLGVTQSNLETPIPYIDIGNECLEAMVTASGPDGVVPAASAHGVVYDTAFTSLAGHLLFPPCSPVAGRPELHDPIVLLGAVPEHSSPAAPVASPAAYDKLRRDFSAPGLPYAQALDVNRNYLNLLEVSRFDALKSFREEIREFLPDPANPPAGFESYLLREPCRPELFCEYLAISPEEYAALFSGAALSPNALFGYPANVSNWIEDLGQVPEFLKRAGLSYCELIALRDALDGKFQIFSRSPAQEVPVCEPCCLQDLFIEFEGDQETLGQLAVFIRLSRILQALPAPRYSFAQLRDICDVLGLFDATTGAVNPDFIRQLSAMRRLEGNFHLPLTDRDDQGAPPNPTGAESTNILALWVGRSARKYQWAVGQLLGRIEACAQPRHGCGRRGPEFFKLLKDNLDPLAVLCGVQPWDKKPTHTLRFAELLGKVRDSKFTVGEILFICTNAPHLAGDDPFPIATARESNESPLDLPDDDGHFSLWALRRKLLSVELNDEDCEKWSWARIDASLKREFGYVPPSTGVDPLTALGMHFFPSILEREGHSVPAGSAWYRAPLAGQSALMWNTPEHGPFRYDAGSSELRARLPLTDDAVLTKLSRLPQLDALQRDAVRDLYFGPRAELARFAFVFANFADASRRLIEEADEDARWSFFRHAFALCHARCSRIAEHLAGYVTRRRDVDDEHCEERRDEAVALAWKVLEHLFAGENMALSTWENDSGQAPAVTWPRPGGGAFAALLGLAGTGLVGEFRVCGSDQVVWRELTGAHLFSPARDAWNAPVPIVIPALDLAIPNDAQLFESVRNGLGLANATAERLGGLQGFDIVLRAGLLIEQEGCYQFWTGAAAEEGELPHCPDEGHRCWRLILKQGGQERVCLSHNWPGEESRASCAEAVRLRRGVHQLEIVFKHPQPQYARHDEICPQRTGFQIKYKGPDTDDRVEVLPFSRLFQERKTQRLSGSLTLGGTAAAFLDTLYTSSLSDIRQTLGRAVKALTLAHRSRLSAKASSDDGQSEIGYMLGHPGRFAGTAYYLSGSAYQSHLAFFDFNLLPMSDVYNPDFDYTPPATVLDERTRDAFSTPPASLKRQQGIFDVIERMLDCDVLRRTSRRAPERDAWLLFHEAAENHPNDPDQLLWHLDVDISHQQAVLNYFGSYSVTTADLEDERWPLRVAYANRFVERVKRNFLTKDIRDARPDLWAADDPGDPATPGNANLIKFVQDGSFENREPERYGHIQRINNGLRERSRTALVAFLCAMNRVTLADGTIAREAKHLSELLLLDVEAGLCERTSRIEEAITAVGLFVQRARLGLEPAFMPGSEFCLLWDSHFSTLRVWEACKRRDVYPENWIELKEFEKARKTEAFRFLEDRLRRAALTSPEPGGDVHWLATKLPPHDGIATIQDKEPSWLQGLAAPREGFALLGVPERQARQSWLARLQAPAQEGAGHEGLPPPPPSRSCSSCLPLWVEAANRLGASFVRVAAAGVPPASLDICRGPDHTGCCTECGKVHEPSIDEYYFWLVDTRYFTEPGASDPYQDPLWNWHDPDTVPTLLQWDSKPMVHLLWSRVRDGRFGPAQRSSEGVRIGSGTPDLKFMGRTGDSLRFEVVAGVAPAGYWPTPPAGFRYDMASDSAVVLPTVAPPPPAPTGLPANPFFLYFPPGDSLYPKSCFSPALAIGDHLRLHCRFETALRWYECAYAPLERDNRWMKCEHDDVQDPKGAVPRMESACCDGTDVDDEDVIQARAAVLRYLETLVQWADSLMCRNSPEAFQKARLILDTASRVLGPAPRTIAQHADAQDRKATVAGFVPQFAPLNPRLVSIYETVDDRLSQIRSCLDRRRLRSGTPNKDMPYWGNNSLRDGWKTNVNVCEDDRCCAPCKPYRFSVLIKLAQDLANEVKGLGAALLAAFEKGDSEHLARLREVHSKRVQTLMLSVHKNQWRENDFLRMSSQKTKELTNQRLQQTIGLFNAGLIAKENQYESQTLQSINWRLASNVAEIGTQVLHMIPDVFPGEVSFTQVPVGTKLAHVGEAVARALGALSEYYGSEAGLHLTEAGFDRRATGWQYEISNLQIEIQQIEDQILAADRRCAASLEQLNIGQRQMEDADEILAFLRDKSTEQDLYRYLQQETAAAHQKALEMARSTALEAQDAFNYERGFTTRSFVPRDTPDGLRQRLLAGDQLQLALKEMEKAYYDENCREYELSKQISLRLHAPFAFLQLKTTGSCEVELPEWLFDQDYPGHYMRRIKSVALTLPCVAGPFVGVHCRLTLLSSSTRIDPRLSDEGEACCTDLPDCDTGYRAKPDDARIVRQYSAVEAIATSGGQMDSGLFELNFQDPRYLPFEGAGAKSRWQVNLSKDTNFFDLDSLSDVVFHLNYTSREGGPRLGAAAGCEAVRRLPGNGLRLFDMPSEFPAEWQAFRDPQACDGRYLKLRMSRRMFPYVTRGERLLIGDIHVFYETECAVSSRHHCIELLDRQSAEHCPPRPGCMSDKIECVASAEWPTLFHGIVAGRELPLGPDCDVDLGSLWFPRGSPAVRRVYLVAQYARYERCSTPVHR